MSKRINVMVSDRLNSLLDMYSERYGVTKSSIVGFVVGQWMDNMERTNELVYGSPNNNNSGFLKDVFQTLKTELPEEECSNEN